MADRPDVPSPEALLLEARRIQPRWNEDAPDLDERHARARALFVQAAEAGHFGAIEALAGGGEGCFPWAVRLARAGDVGELVSALTSGDHPVSLAREVLTAADADEPWAQLAVAGVYDLGMENTATGVLVATQPDGFGWLPAAADPRAEARRRAERALAAGPDYAPAALWLAFADRYDAPAQALAFLTVALADLAALPPGSRAQAKKLLPELLEETGAEWDAQFAARRALAASGDAEAQAWLGDRYRTGEGVAADAVAARGYYEPAAAAGDVDACRELGRMCEAGEGGPVDEDRARELYERAAEFGADPFSRDRLAEKFGLAFFARTPDER